MSGLIFDLDGTLIDSAPDIHLHACAMMRAESLPEPTLAEVHGYIGKGVAHFISAILAFNNVPETQERTERMHTNFLRDYETRIERTTLYPKAAETLRALQAEGFQLGLCTNKPEAPTKTVLDHFNLTDLFCAFSYGDSPGPRKPDPAPVRRVISQMQARDFLYIGDSETDAATAQNAGLPMVLFTEGYRKTPVHDLPHDISFNHFSQLRGIIDRLAPLPE